MLGAGYLLRKTNLLVIALFLGLFILIVNAAENSINESIIENNQFESLTEYNNSYISNDSNISNNLESSNNAEKQGKAVTASFGVYLQIVG